LSEDPKVLNLDCKVSDSNLILGQFSEVSFELSEVCGWVHSDLKKNGVSEQHEQILPSVSPHTGFSVCKGYPQFPSFQSMCTLLQGFCSQAEETLNSTVNTFKSSRLTQTSLFPSHTLDTIMDMSLNATISSLLLGMKRPSKVVNEWASQNMPILYAFLQSHLNKIQALNFHAGNSERFRDKVNRECSRVYDGGYDRELDMSKIGDGICHIDLNVPECLYDGGDCTVSAENPTLLTGSGSNIYRAGYGPLASLNDNLHVLNDYYKMTDANGDIAKIEDSVPQNRNPDYDFNYSRDVTNAYCPDDSSPLCNESNVNGSGSFNFKDYFSGHFSAGVTERMANENLVYDEFMCGNNQTWTDVYEIGTEYILFDALNNRTYNFSYVGDNRIGNRPYSPTNLASLKEKYAQFNLTLKYEAPGDNPPRFSKRTYSCDRLQKETNFAGFDETLSTIEAWRMHYMDIYCLDKGLKNGCSERIDYPDGIVRFGYPDGVDLDLYILEAEWAWVVATVKENSGSFYDLNLDLCLKRNIAGHYSTSVTVNYEKYYNASRVSSCIYTRRASAEPQTIVSILLGLIGGVVALSNAVGLSLYLVMKKIFLKKNSQK